MSDTVRIEDLIPSESSFTLKHTEKTYFLRPCTAGLLLEMNKKVGDSEQLLGNPTAENIAKMALFLMKHEDAMDFKRQVVKTIDVMTGEENEEEIGGYILLMHLFHGVKEQLHVYTAILESMGFSRDRTQKIIDSFIEDTNSKVEKQAGEIKKKTS